MGLWENAIAVAEGEAPFVARAAEGRFALDVFDVAQHEVCALVGALSADGKPLCPVPKHHNVLASDVDTGARLFRQLPLHAAGHGGSLDPGDDVDVHHVVRGEVVDGDPIQILWYGRCQPLEGQRRPRLDPFPLPVHLVRMCRQRHRAVGQEQIGDSYVFDKRGSPE